MIRLQTLLFLIEVAGTLAFALSGFLEAMRKRMDIVGLTTVAFVAAFGGGTVRDVLLDRRPFFWVEHSEYLWLVLGLCVLALLALRKRHVAWTQRAMRWPDALGLGLFSIAGTSIAVEMGQPLIVAALMGVITGVFGGVLRDVLCNEVPAIFSDHRPYAVCALTGAGTYIAIHQFGGPHLVALLTGILVTAGLRMVALWRGWRVPGWREEHEN